MALFILEIGTEEIPARFLKDEQNDLFFAFSKALEQQALEYDSIKVFVTPRRATVMVYGMRKEQAFREKIIQGPAKKISFAPDGTPTKALNGFLASNEASIDEIEIITSDKGEYVAVRKKLGGKSAKEILSEICPEIIKGLAFPKSMRWGEYSLRYARPIKWIMALLDDEEISFSVDHLSSGRQTYGHRVHGFGPFTVKNAAEYENILNDRGKVVLDGARRKRLIVEKADDEAKRAGGKVIWNDALLDEVAGLAETPEAILGEFDAKYLELPREALLTSMQTHQKSFGVENEKGELLPYFITVLNIHPEDVNAVKNGWEKVLRARLEDARFFWEEDLKTGFEKWRDKLKNVIFIGPLGTMSAKTERLEKLAAYLAEAVELDEGKKSDLKEAAALSKADLVSGMVGEFDTLQGVMGGIYAGKLLNNSAVAEAIKEQYLPTGPESPLPGTVEGSLLAVADKIDTLAGCFGLKMIPSGGADPNGLRRNALGVIRIILDRRMNISLQALLEQAYKLYGSQEWKVSENERKELLENFFKTRMRNYHQQAGYETALIDSVLAAGTDNIYDASLRLESLSKLKESEHWLPVMQSMKRIQNILDKNGEALPEQVDEKSLVEQAEKEFARALAEKSGLIDQNLSEQNYEAALSEIQSLVPALTRMFEDVMIMSDNEKIRLNRLALLKALGDRFAKIASVSLLQI